MPHQKLSSLSFYFLVFSVFLVSCGKKDKTDFKIIDVTSADSIATDTIQVATSIDDVEQHELVRFRTTADDYARRKLTSLPAFDIVFTTIEKYLTIQDSLESARKLWGQPLTDPKDTAMVYPYKERAYQAIIDYKNQMASTPSVVQPNFTTLLSLTRTAEPNDSSSYILPKAQASTLLNAGDFFFIGGFPFLSKLSPMDDSNIFTDQHGNPETRFGLSLQENSSYLLNSVLYAKSTAINITYGPPLDTYEMGAVEVYGIGSLIHNFTERIPAFFITRSGLEPAHLLSVERKIASDYSCNEGQVAVQFAYAGSIDEEEIQGIYIPYGTPPKSSIFKRLSDNVWTADLNSDGTADFACITNNFMGDMGYELAEAVWYANINGEWKIIDWAEIPECT
jgi:hypothetical protein